MKRILEHENGWRTVVTPSWAFAGMVKLKLQRHMFGPFWTTLNEYLILPLNWEEVVEDGILKAATQQYNEKLERLNQHAATAAYFKE